MRRPSGRVSRRVRSLSTRRQQDLKHRKESGRPISPGKENSAQRPKPSRTRRIGTAQRRRFGSYRPSGDRSGSEGEIGGRLARSRAACDRFFERFKADQAELVSKAEPRESVIRELEQLLSQDGSAAATPPDGLFTVIQQARARWQQAPELPRQMQQDLAVRFHEALGRLMATWPAAFSGTDLDPDVTRRRMEKLVTRVESWPPRQGITARLTPAELLARQWRGDSRRTPAGGDAPKPTNHAGARPNRMCGMRRWSGRGGPVPADVAAPLNERFQRACRRFFRGEVR